VWCSTGQNEDRATSIRQLRSRRKRLSALWKTTLVFSRAITLRCEIFYYAALVQSDNIAAYTLAYHVGSKLESLAPGETGSKYTPVDAFVAQMNALAKQLKMDRTRFVNPHGVDYKVKPLPYSTAEDMARLTRYAMNKASFRFYVSQKERQISFDRGGRRLNYVLRNTNDLLGKMGIDGVKTGRHRAIR